MQKDQKAIRIISEALDNTCFDNQVDFRVKQTMQGFIIALFEINNFSSLKFEFLKK